MLAVQRVYDDASILVITEKQKKVYEQLADQKYVAITAMAENFVVRLEGKAQVVDELDYIFENNPEAKEHEDNKENMVTFKITYDLSTAVIRDNNGERSFKKFIE